jgi:predicted N-acetyltransferase YhbS
MDVLSKFTAFCSRDGRDILPATVLMVNFRRLKNEADLINGETNANPSTGLSSADDDNNNNYSDIFHSMAALYATALPDMELEAIYGCLDKPSHSVIVVATDEAVMSYRKKHGEPNPIRRTMTNKGTPSLEEVSNDGDNHIIDDGDIDGGYYCNIFSDSEDEGGEGDGEEEEVGVHDIEREEYVKRVMERRQSNTLIGLEDKLIGCVTFMRLSSKPGESSVQILLLSVRHRWRGYGVGEYLLSMTKDPSIVGHYDIILTYADHKAEKFFMRYGFTDDPIITTRHKTTVDYWENSTLMSYIPPYSGKII